MTRRPYWRGSGPRREGRSESDFGVVEADREAARNRPEGDGLRWFKLDLHIHTPASSDYRDPGVSYLDILKKAERENLDLIAFADHNTVAGYTAMHREIETLTLLDRLGRANPEERQTLSEYKRLLAKIVVLPAFEFTATFGFHILGIFPENTSTRKLEYLLLNLNVPEEKMVAGAPDAGSTSDVLAAYAAIRGAGGMAIAAHANSSNGVAMQGFPFGGQTKIAYTQDVNLTALEVTDLESLGRRTTAAFYNGTKTEYPRRMHCIQGSDAHSIETEQSDSNNKRLGVGARITEVLMRDASFASLKETLSGDDFTRTRPYRANWLWDMVDAARAQGPNVAQSFHERAVTHTSRTRPILHDVAAFANTSGGTIYVGANPDRNVPLHGLERAEEDLRMLKEDIRSTIEPPVEVEFDLRQNGRRAIIAISVPEGKEKPYIFTPTSQIYTRTRADTHLATRQEIINLVLSSQGLPPAVTRQPSPGSRQPIGEPLSPGQKPPKAVPVPTHGVERPAREQPQEAQNAPSGRGRDSDRQPGDGAERRQSTQQPQRGEQRQAQPAQPTSPPAERPRPAWMANLPPERIKGQVQPMLRPEQSPAPMPAPEESPADSIEQTLAPIEEPQPAPEEARSETTPATKPRRGRPRKSTIEEAAASQQSQMEATVAAEHETREEIVAEAAQEKPRRGRRRKADLELQVEAPTAASAETEAGQEAILVEAEIEPGPQIPAELPPPEEPQPVEKKPRGRRKTAAQKAAEASLELAEDIASSEMAAPHPEPATEEPPTKTKGRRTRKKEPTPAEAPPSSAQTSVLSPQSSSLPPPPATGVEIVAVEERNGNHYHTMRDLRNGQTVHNVTRQSARRLWLYAVQQSRRGAPEISEVYWHPEAPIGVWRRGSRAGALRYDLVARYEDGSFRVFYGVTPEGLTGPWSEVARMAEEAGYEGPDAGE